jgi:hypothetical protein
MYGAPVREGRVAAVIIARVLLGRLGLHRPGLVLICLTGRSSQAHEGDDLTNYGAFGPFVRSFILLVDPGDICPPQDPSFFLLADSLDRAFPWLVAVFSPPITIFLV